MSFNIVCAGSAHSMSLMLSAGSAYISHVCLDTHPNYFSRVSMSSRCDNCEATDCRSEKTHGGTRKQTHENSLYEM